MVETRKSFIQLQKQQKSWLFHLEAQSRFGLHVENNKRRLI